MITATVDIRSLENGLRDMLRRAETAGPYFHALLPEVREDQKDHARAQEGPEGKWPSWSSSYQDKLQRRRSRKRRRKPRKPLGRLPSAVQYRAGSDSVEARSRVRWSGVHQEGGRAGNGADVPARTFLWFSDDFLEDAAQSLADYAAIGWA